MGRRTPRPLKAAADASALLDAFFSALADEDRRELILAICGGVVTGAALSAKFGWPPDATAKQIAKLRKGGLIEAPREGRWVRLLPRLTGVSTAQAWVTELRGPEPPSTARSTTTEQRIRRARELSTPSRRSLLTQIGKRGSATQVELAIACGASQSVTSRGMNSLEACGLVRVQRDGRRPGYSSNPAAIESLWAWLALLEAKLSEGRRSALAVQLPDPGKTEDEADAGEAGDVPSARVAPALTIETDADESARPTDAPSSDGAEEPDLASRSGDVEGLEEVAPAPDAAASVDATSSAALTGDSGPAAQSAAPPPTSASAVSAVAGSPKRALRTVPHSLDADDIRSGQCFVDKSGHLIRVDSMQYGEITYSERHPGRPQVTSKKELRHRLRERLARAIDPSGFNF